MALEAHRCRRCGVRLTRVSGRHRILTAVCTECSERQPILCPSCQRPLAADPGSDVGRCALHGTFRLDRGSVVHLAPPDPAPVAPPPLPIESGLRVRTMIAPAGGSYRDGQTQGYEVVHRDHGRRTPSFDDRPSRATAKMIGLVTMWMLVTWLVGTLLLVFAPPWMSPVVVFGAALSLVLGLLVARPSSRTRAGRAAETSLRIDPERLERTVDGVSSTIEMRSVRSVRRLPVAPRTYRVEVELEDRPPIVLLDELGEDESEEVEAIVREQLERRSRT
jgi:hypothetical protein